MRAHSLCRVRQRVRKSSRVIVYSFAVTAGVKWVSLFLTLFRCFFAQTTTLLNRELTSVSFSKSTLTSFLSPLPPTTPDICVVLPDSGRCELAVRQRFVGRSDPGVAALDQESPGSIPGGAIIKGRSANAGGPFDCPSVILAPRCRFGDEPRRGNSKRDAMTNRVALLVFSPESPARMIDWHPTAGDS